MISILIIVSNSSKEDKANIQKRYDKYARAKKDPDGVRRYEAQFIYRPKNQTASEEAFDHLNKLIPCMENAFLFRERINVGKVDNRVAARDSEKV